LHRKTIVHTLVGCGSSRILTREDPDAVDEQRFVTLGLSDEANLLVIVYTYWEPDILRVLSAWRANKRQRELNEKGRS